MMKDFIERVRHNKRSIALTLGVIALATSFFWLPALLRPLDFFHVRRVTVRGIRYVDERALVRLMKIDTTVSIWNSLDVYESRVADHPQVRSVRLGRRLPSTIIVTVEENLPVAFVPAARGGALRAYDEDARILPIDPTRFYIDLPILSRPDTALLRLLADLRRLDPAMYARVSDVERTGRDEAIVFLSSLPVRVRSTLPAERFGELRAVEEDLARRGLNAAELDLRFRDRVIVRLQ